MKKGFPPIRPGWAYANKEFRQGRLEDFVTRLDKVSTSSRSARGSRSSRKTDSPSTSSDYSELRRIEFHSLKGPGKSTQREDSPRRVGGSSQVKDHQSKVAIGKVGVTGQVAQGNPGGKGTQGHQKRGTKVVQGVGGRLKKAFGSCIGRGC